MDSLAAWAKRRQEAIQVVLHELDNVSSALKFWTHEAVRGPSHSFRASEFSRALEKTAPRVGRLLADLCAGSGEAGRPAVEPSHGVVPAALVEAAAEGARRAAPDRTIDIELAPGLAAVWGDEVRVLQVLANLLANAIKFSATPMPVIIGAHPGSQAGEVVFFVRDKGIGIDPADQPRIFEPGFQVKRGDSRGSGLGLAICKEIIEAHGESFFVESRVGVGSTFGFALRAREL